MHSSILFYGTLKIIALRPFEVSREWTRVSVHGPGPVGRYGHAVTMAGSKFIVFGGQVDGQFLNDVWSFDLNSRKFIHFFSPFGNIHVVQSGQKQYGNFWNLLAARYLPGERVIFASPLETKSSCKFLFWKS